MEVKSFSCVSLDAASTWKSSSIQTKADESTALVASNTGVDASNLEKSPVASASGKAQPSGGDSTKVSEMNGVSTPKPKSTQLEAACSTPKTGGGTREEEKTFVTED